MHALTKRLWMEPASPQSIILKIIEDGRIRTRQGTDDQK
jgi:hypothetical protein